MWDKKIYHTVYFKKMLSIGIVILVGIVLAFIILRMEKTPVRESHEDAASQHHESAKVKGPHGGTGCSSPV